MTTELQTKVQDKKPVMMKGGLVHWVKEETWDRIGEILANQKGHQFMKISELGITINTAEIDGVYTIKQYQDMCRIKEGMWQCEYGTWHNKGKRECQCREEAQKKRKQIEDEKRREAENRPLTQQELERRKETLKKVSEEGALKQAQKGMESGVFYQMYRIGNRNRKKIRRSTITEWIKKNGEVEVKGLLIDEKS